MLDFTKNELLEILKIAEIQYKADYLKAAKDLDIIKMRIEDHDALPTVIELFQRSVDESLAKLERVHAAIAEL